MTEKIEKIMKRVIIETLEQLAYVFSSPEDEMDLLTPDSMAVTVDFSGPFSGQLTMKTTTLVVLELTANMLGIDEEEITLEQQSDALKETVNILCGNLLPAIAGDQDIFNINAPKIIDSEEIEEPEKAFSKAYLSIDDEMCVVYLFVDGDMNAKDLGFD